MSVQGFNISLDAASPTFLYSPFRDGDPNLGWNASYSESRNYSPFAGLDLTGALGNGTAFRRTQSDNASVTLNFSGTAVYLCFTPSSSYTFTLDGKSVDQIADPSGDPCTSYAGLPSTLAFADDLPYGTHTAVLTGSNVEFYGGSVTVNVGEPGATVETNVIDDAGPGWSWVPPLIYQPGASWVRDPPGSEGNNNNTDIDGGKTWTCMYNDGAVASYNVTNASAIEVLGWTCSNSGVYTVSFNGASKSYNASNFWQETKQVLYFADDLDPSQQYPLLITNGDGTKNTPYISTQDCIDLDAVIIYKATAPSLSNGTSPLPIDSRATPVAAIAGGVVGGAVFLLLLAAATFLYMRRQHRVGHAVFPCLGNGLDSPRVTAPTPYIITTMEGSGPHANRGTHVNSYHSEVSSPPMVHTSSTRKLPILGLQGESRPEDTSGARRLNSEIVPSMADLQGANTVDLIDILNERLRRDQADNLVDPPLYPGT